MDYLDPKKELEHRIILLVGYVLVAVAIGIASIILLYQAYGFGIGKNGTVIQSGLTFFSSQPHPAKIRLNGVLNNAATNARLELPAGIYQVTLSRSGYKDWHRTIELPGGSVEHFDYPVLFPNVLTTTKMPGADYKTAPSLVTQSPDQRWLVVGQPDSATNFDLYDLKNPVKTPVVLSLPASLLSPATTSQSWQLVEWADDNQHVLLQHNFDDKTEYVLLDRTDGAQSTNLNTALTISPTKLSLANKKFDQYYLYDAPSGLLQAASKTAAKTTVLEHVLAYKPYSDNTFLYVTGDKAPAGKVLVKMVVDGKAETLRSLALSPDYLLDLTKYSGTMYVAVGSTAGNKVYIYQDPFAQLAQQPNQAPGPVQVLHVAQPNYLSFSTNAQFIVTENGPRFGVYDIENKVGYNYSLPQALDAPQLHASWMDGDRLAYISRGKLTVFDYDATNAQALSPAGSSFLPAFAPDYKHVYVVNPNASTGQFELTETSLLAAGDH